MLKKNWNTEGYNYSVMNSVYFDNFRNVYKVCFYFIYVTIIHLHHKLDMYTWLAP